MDFGPRVCFFRRRSACAKARSNAVAPHLFHQAVGLGHVGNAPDVVEDAGAQLVLVKLLAKSGVVGLDDQRDVAGAGLERFEDLQRAGIARVVAQRDRFEAVELGDRFEQAGRCRGDGSRPRRSGRISVPPVPAPRTKILDRGQVERVDARRRSAGEPLGQIAGRPAGNQGDQVEEDVLEIEVQLKEKSMARRTMSGCWARLK